MMIYEHVLEGCAPIPLASYLKALGVFRLVAEQKDPDARGFWRNERFVLKTRLAKDELVGFFVDEYQPSPIISPWNGRAGFLEGEDDEGESTRGGAELVRAYEAASDRFHNLRDAAAMYKNAASIRSLDRARVEAKPLQAKKAKKATLTDDEKSRLKSLDAEVKRLRGDVVGGLRSEAPDPAIDWFDACRRGGLDNAPMPLLGSGGLDGSRDFGMNFGEALEAVFDLTTGRAKPRIVELVETSVFAATTSGLKKGNAGQYDPGAVGENISTGFSAEQPFNPFDLILLLEGTMLFYGAATRRLGSTASVGASFPFTVKALTAGSGAAAMDDDSGFAEFWAPIWTRSASFVELKALLTEGRVAIADKVANDGLQFAVAVSNLGAARGISQFQRYALLQREPRNPRKATPLGRISVRESPRASLISDLGRGNWLVRLRAAVSGDDASAGLQACVRRLDNALFRMAADESWEAVQQALIAIGEIALACARRPKLRTSDKKNGQPPLPPPPRLSAEWTQGADDGSHEFALAAALACLDATAESDEHCFRLPFRRHLAPMNVVAKKYHVENRWYDVKDQWDEKTEAHALAVWTGRDLIRDMGRVLERRLIEAQRKVFVRRVGLDKPPEPELPLYSWRTAPLSSVAAFIEGRTDDDRVAALAAGLAWARTSAPTAEGLIREDILPFAYAALKPLFTHSGIENETGRRLVDPLPLVRLLRADRGDEAVGLAQRMARGAGLSTPFASRSQIAAPMPERLAAALLFPIASMAVERLVARAYPEMNSERKNTDVA
jgi:CRISPR-associated protein Csx17